MEDEEVEVELDEGMPVENEEGDELGTLAGLLVEEDEEDAEFLLVATAAGERLVPFEAVLGVGDGKLVLDVRKEDLPRFPQVQGEGPTDAEMELAYAVYDKGSGDDSDEG